MKNSKTRKSTSKAGVRKRKRLSITHPNAAGIDLGSRSHFVCVPPDRDNQNVREFKCYTQDINALAKWLKECGVDTVAMESTGVEWIPVFDILVKKGFKLSLVNAYHLKNVPGKKTDVKDCQWIQELHSYGLLSASFRPGDDIVALRGLVRHRQSLVKSSGIHIQRMQKALTQMNVHLHKAISDIAGVSGKRIIEAIVNGVHDPKELAKLGDRGLKKSPQKVAKYLEGNFRFEHVFTLKQEFGIYNTFQENIAQCDEEIKKYYQKFKDKSDAKKPLKKHKAQKHIPADLQKNLNKVTGLDFTQINGIKELCVQTIISEIGLDHTKWPTEKHFASWLGLCPNNRITGGKVYSTRSRKVVNRAAMAFRQAATTLRHSKSALGVFHRRMRSKLGPMKAVTATAHKLACIFYRMMKYGDDFVDIGMAAYEAKLKERQIKSLQKRANDLGYTIALAA